MPDDRKAPFPLRAVLRGSALLYLRRTAQYCAVLRGVADKLLMLMYANYVK